MARVWSLRIAAAVLLAAMLWRVIHVNAVVYEVTGHQRLPSTTGADLGQGTGDLEMLRAQLRENPGHVAALLLVARIESETDTVAAARAYAAAYQLAPLDREVLHAAAAFFLAQDRKAEALVLLARLVEHYPAERPLAFPVIAGMLGERSANAIDTIAAGNPEWVGAFIVASCQRGVEPSVLLPLFMKRIASASATPAETACLVDHLRGAERWDEAYQVWLNSLSRERLGDIGFIFNGSFEFAPSGIGFDWMPTRQLEREVGHSIEIARTTGGSGRRSLKVTFNGKRQVGIPIAQYLALAPGLYQFTGMGRSDGMRAGRGVYWTVRCVTESIPGAAIASSERFTGSSEWRAFEFAVTIPASCRGQILQLEPVGVDEGPAYVTGAAWFDDLAMRVVH